MSGRGGLTSEKEALSPAGPTAEPHAAAKKIDGSSIEDSKEVTDEVEDLKEKGEEEEEEEEEMSSSAHLEPSTLPWPGDRRPLMDNYDGRVSEPGEGNTGTSGGSQDLQEEQSRAESDRKAKAKWRESMPEGERWRDDEIDMQKDDKGDGSLADDEEEEDEEEYKGESHWMSEKAAMGFTPQVTIVRPSRKEDEESSIFIERDEKEEVQMEPDSAGQFYPEWREQEDKCYLCEHLCSEKLKVVLATVAAGILFPLLVWGGYALLPFDSPLLVGSPLRVVYTLRCSFFAVIPILLGMMVLGIVRLRHTNLKPLYQSKLVNREVAAQWHYVNESMALFLFFFVQLAVMATYISQDLMKLVPLLTIIFVFGRLFYWLCISLGSSSIRSFGFGLSFLPILVMMGINLYFVCSSVGQGGVFDVAPPATPPPPRMRWWF